MMDFLIDETRNLNSPPITVKLPSGNHYYLFSSGLFLLLVKLSSDGNIIAKVKRELIHVFSLIALDD